MSAPVQVIGVGMVKFVKPGTQEPYEIMASKAIRAALADAGIPYDEIQQAYASYVFGDSACGQAALYRVGMTGIPLFNVNNNCSSGSSALFLARQAVLSGSVDCALAFGFEEMRPGALGAVWNDRTSPLLEMEDQLENIVPGVPPASNAHRLFGSAALAYIEKTGANPDIFAKVAVKTRKHAMNNPLAIFNQPLTVDEVMQSPVIFAPYLTRLEACPPSCGAAAAVVCSEAFARRHGLARGIPILAQAMTTDRPARNDNPIDLAGADMTRNAAAQVYAQAGIGPQDIDVVELHDCFTSNEVITYEGLGLCGEGEAEGFIARGDNTYGGRYVVNPSGGLMSKGHPLGATGLAQCTELVSQLRGEAGARQVSGARLALQHNLGLGGACVVTLYGKGI
ncbi:lipid-transfer protein [Thauera chlorobenzoica]|uniref:propanoyl-CoA C-acyltransferase n=1 Tax=Thauera chlorobenzoica TaxID=96773 RepID=A0A1H5WI37_9RHOO|nr:lipid-transfer protein [Thauera chlorobenzoica]APR04436.1 thiolase [Thauera chlorobenzoica]SEF99124.1 Acetyl-CoA acetyltransferase [Thauera chlorobenzoica]